MNNGVFVIVSGPAGVGKDSILEKLLLTDENYSLSISDTTRAIRKNEKVGFHYRFISKQEFVNNINEGKMLEWAEYNNNYYGTPKEPVEKNLQAGKDVILEIDVKGSLLVKEKFPKVIMIFVMPPSFSELKKRLVNRGSETKESIENRLAAAKIEMEQAKEYDYVIINDEVDEAVEKISSIIKSEKLRYNKMKKKVEEVLRNV